MCPPGMCVDFRYRVDTCYGLAMAPRPIADAAMMLTPVKEVPLPPPAQLERITLDDLDEDERQKISRDGEWIPPRK